MQRFTIESSLGTDPKSASATDVVRRLAPHARVLRGSAQQPVGVNGVLEMARPPLATGGVTLKVLGEDTNNPISGKRLRKVANANAQIEERYDALQRQQAKLALLFRSRIASGQPVSPTEQTETLQRGVFPDEEEAVPHRNETEVFGKLDASRPRADMPKAGAGKQQSMLSDYVVGDVPAAGSHTASGIGAQPKRAPLGRMATLLPSTEESVFGDAFSEHDTDDETIEETGHDVLDLELAIENDRQPPTSDASVAAGAFDYAGIFEDRELSATIDGVVNDAQSTIDALSGVRQEKAMWAPAQKPLVYMIQRLFDNRSGDMIKSAEGVTSETEKIPEIALLHAVRQNTLKRLSLAVPKRPDSSMPLWHQVDVELAIGLQSDSSKSVEITLSLPNMDEAPSVQLRMGVLYSFVTPNAPLEGLSEAKYPHESLLYRLMRVAEVDDARNECDKEAKKLFEKLQGGSSGVSLSIPTDGFDRRTPIETLLGKFHNEVRKWFGGHNVWSTALGASSSSGSSSRSFHVTMPPEVMEVVARACGDGIPLWMAVPNRKERGTEVFRVVGDKCADLVASSPRHAYTTQSACGWLTLLFKAERSLGNSAKRPASHTIAVIAAVDRLSVLLSDTSNAGIWEQRTKSQGGGAERMVRLCNEVAHQAHRALLHLSYLDLSSRTEGMSDSERQQYANIAYLMARVVAEVVPCAYNLRAFSQEGWQGAVGATYGPATSRHPTGAAEAARKAFLNCAAQLRHCACCCVEPLANFQLEKGMHSSDLSPNLHFMALFLARHPNRPGFEDQMSKHAREMLALPSEGGQEGVNVLVNLLCPNGTLMPLNQAIGCLETAASAVVGLFDKDLLFSATAVEAKGRYDCTYSAQLYFRIAQQHLMYHVPRQVAQNEYDTLPGRVNTNDRNRAASYLDMHRCAGIASLFVTVMDDPGLRTDVGWDLWEKWRRESHNLTLGAVPHSERAPGTTANREEETVVLIDGADVTGDQPPSLAEPEMDQRTSLVDNLPMDSSKRDFVLGPDSPSSDLRNTAARNPAEPPAVNPGAAPLVDNGKQHSHYNRTIATVAEKSVDLVMKTTSGVVSSLVSATASLSDQGFDEARAAYYGTLNKLKVLRAAGRAMTRAYNDVYYHPMMEKLRKASPSIMSVAKWVVSFGLLAAGGSRMCGVAQPARGHLQSNQDLVAVQKVDDVFLTRKGQWAYDTQCSDLLVDYEPACRTFTCILKPDGPGGLTADHAILYEAAASAKDIGIEPSQLLKGMNITGNMLFTYVQYGVVPKGFEPYVHQFEQAAVSVRKYGFGMMIFSARDRRNVWCRMFVTPKLKETGNPWREYARVMRLSNDADVQRARPPLPNNLSTADSAPGEWFMSRAGMIWLVEQTCRGIRHSRSAVSSMGTTALAGLALEAARTAPQRAGGMSVEFYDRTVRQIEGLRAINRTLGHSSIAQACKATLTYARSERNKSWSQMPEDSELRHQLNLTGFDAHTDADESIPVVGAAAHVKEVVTYECTPKTMLSDLEQMHRVEAALGRLTYAIPKRASEQDAAGQQSGIVTIVEVANMLMNVVGAEGRVAHVCRDSEQDYVQSNFSMPRFSSSFDVLNNVRVLEAVVELFLSMPPERRPGFLWAHSHRIFQESTRALCQAAATGGAFALDSWTAARFAANTIDRAMTSDGPDPELRVSAEAAGNLERVFAELMRLRYAWEAPAEGEAPDPLTGWKAARAYALIETIEPRHPALIAAGRAVYCGAVYNNTGQEIFFLDRSGVSALDLSPHTSKSSMRASRIMGASRKPLTEKAFPNMEAVESVATEGGWFDSAWSTATWVLGGFTTARRADVASSIGNIGPFGLFGATPPSPPAPPPASPPPPNVAERTAKREVAPAPADRVESGRRDRPTAEKKLQISEREDKLAKAAFKQCLEEVAEICDDCTPEEKKAMKTQCIAAVEGALEEVTATEERSALEAGTPIFTSQAVAFEDMAPLLASRRSAMRDRIQQNYARLMDQTKLAISNTTNASEKAPLKKRLAAMEAAYAQVGKSIANAVDDTDRKYYKALEIVVSKVPKQRAGQSRLFYVGFDPSQARKEILEERRKMSPEEAVEPAESAELLSDIEEVDAVPPGTFETAESAPPAVQPKAIFRAANKRLTKCVTRLLSAAVADCAVVINTSTTGGKTAVSCHEASLACAVRGRELLQNSPASAGQQYMGGDRVLGHLDRGVSERCLPRNPVVTASNSRRDFEDDPLHTVRERATLVLIGIIGAIASTMQNKPTIATLTVPEGQVDDEEPSAAELPGEPSSDIMEMDASADVGVGFLTPVYLAVPLAKAMTKWAVVEGTKLGYKVSKKVVKGTWRVTRTVLAAQTTRRLLTVLTATATAAEMWQLGSAIQHASQYGSALSANAWLMLTSASAVTWLVGQSLGHMHRRQLRRRADDEPRTATNSAKIGTWGYEGDADAGKVDGTTFGEMTESMHLTSLACAGMMIGLGLVLTGYKSTVAPMFGYDTDPEKYGRSSFPGTEATRASVASNANSVVQSDNEFAACFLKNGVDLALVAAVSWICSWKLPDRGLGQGMLGRVQRCARTVRARWNPGHTLPVLQNDDLQTVFDLHLAGYTLTMGGMIGATVFGSSPHVCSIMLQIAGVGRVLIEQAYLTETRSAAGAVGGAFVRVGWVLNKLYSAVAFVEMAFAHNNGEHTSIKERAAMFQTVNGISNIAGMEAVASLAYMGCPDVAGLDRTSPPVSLVQCMWNGNFDASGVVGETVIDNIGLVTAGYNVLFVACVTGHYLFMVCDHFLGTTVFQRPNVAQAMGGAQPRGRLLGSRAYGAMAAASVCAMLYVGMSSVTDYSNVLVGVGNVMKVNGHRVVEAMVNTKSTAALYQALQMLLVKVLKAQVGRQSEAGVVRTMRARAAMHGAAAGIVVAADAVMGGYRGAVREVMSTGDAVVSGMSRILYVVTENMQMLFATLSTVNSPYDLVAKVIRNAGTQYAWYYHGVPLGVLASIDAEKYGVAAATVVNAASRRLVGGSGIIGSLLEFNVGYTSPKLAGDVAFKMLTSVREQKALIAGVNISTRMAAEYVLDGLGLCQGEANTNTIIKQLAAKMLDPYVSSEYLVAAQQVMEYLCAQHNGAYKGSGSRAWQPTGVVLMDFVQLQNYARYPLTQLLNNLGIMNGFLGRQHRGGYNPANPNHWACLPFDSNDKAVAQFLHKFQSETPRGETRWQYKQRVVRSVVALISVVGSVPALHYASDSLAGVRYTYGENGLMRPSRLGMPTRTDFTEAVDTAVESGTNIVELAAGKSENPLDVGALYKHLLSFKTASELNKGWYARTNDERHFTEMMPAAQEVDSRDHNRLMALTGRECEVSPFAYRMQRLSKAVAKDLQGFVGANCSIEHDLYLLSERPLDPVGTAQAMEQLWARVDSMATNNTEWLALFGHNVVSESVSIGGRQRTSVGNHALVKWMSSSAPVLRVLMTALDTFHTLGLAGPAVVHRVAAAGNRANNAAPTKFRALAGGALSLAAGAVPTVLSEVYRTRASGTASSHRELYQEMYNPQGRILRMWAEFQNRYELLTTSSKRRPKTTAQEMEIWHTYNKFFTESGFELVVNTLGTRDALYNRTTREELIRALEEELKTTKDSKRRRELEFAVAFLPNVMYLEASGLTPRADAVLRRALDQADLVTPYNFDACWVAILGETSFRDRMSARSSSAPTTQPQTPPPEPTPYFRPVRRARDVNRQGRSSQVGAWKGVVPQRLHMPGGMRECQPEAEIGTRMPRVDASGDGKKRPAVQLSGKDLSQFLNGRIQEVVRAMMNWRDHRESVDASTDLIKTATELKQAMRNNRPLHTETCSFSCPGPTRTAAEAMLAYPETTPDPVSAEDGKSAPSEAVTFGATLPVLADVPPPPDDPSKPPPPDDPNQRLLMDPGAHVEAYLGDKIASNPLGAAAAQLLAADEQPTPRVLSIKPLCITPRNLWLGGKNRQNPRKETLYPHGQRSGDNSAMYLLPFANTSEALWEALDGNWDRNPLKANLLVLTTTFSSDSTATRYCLNMSALVDTLTRNTGGLAYCGVQLSLDDDKGSSAVNMNAVDHAQLLRYLTALHLRVLAPPPSPPSDPEAPSDPEVEKLANSSSVVPSQGQKAVRERIVAAVSGDDNLINTVIKNERNNNNNNKGIPPVSCFVRSMESTGHWRLETVETAAGRHAIACVHAFRGMRGCIPFTPKTQSRADITYAVSGSSALVQQRADCVWRPLGLIERACSPDASLMSWMKGASATKPFLHVDRLSNGSVVLGARYVGNTVDSNADKRAQVKSTQKEIEQRISWVCGVLRAVTLLKLCSYGDVASASTDNATSISGDECWKDLCERANIAKESADGKKLTKLFDKLQGATPFEFPCNVDVSYNINDMFDRHSLESLLLGADARVRTANSGATTTTLVSALSSYYSPAVVLVFQGTMLGQTTKSTMNNYKSQGRKLLDSWRDATTSGGYQSDPKVGVKMGTSIHLSRFRLARNFLAQMDNRPYDTYGANPTRKVDKDTFVDTLDRYVTNSDLGPAHAYMNEQRTDLPGTYDDPSERNHESALSDTRATYALGAGAVYALLTSDQSHESKPEKDAGGYHVNERLLRSALSRSTAAEMDIRDLAAFENHVRNFVFLASGMTYNAQTDKATQSTGVLSVIEEYFPTTTAYASSALRTYAGMVVTDGMGDRADYHADTLGGHISRASEMVRLAVRQASVVSATRLLQVFGIPMYLSRVNSNDIPENPNIQPEQLINVLMTMVAAFGVDRVNAFMHALIERYEFDARAYVNGIDAEAVGSRAKDTTKIFKKLLAFVYRQNLVFKGTVLYGVMHVATNVYTVPEFQPAEFFRQNMAMFTLSPATNAILPVHMMGPGDGNRGAHGNLWETSLYYAAAMAATFAGMQAVHLANTGTFTTLSYRQNRAVNATETANLARQIVVPELRGTNDDRGSAYVAMPPKHVVDFKRAYTRHAIAAAARRSQFGSDIAPSASLARVVQSPSNDQADLLFWDSGRQLATRLKNAASLADQKEKNDVDALYANPRYMLPRKTKKGYAGENHMLVKKMEAAMANDEKALQLYKKQIAAIEYAQRRLRRAKALESKGIVKNMQGLLERLQNERWEQFDTKFASGIYAFNTFRVEEATLDAVADAAFGRVLHALGTPDLDDPFLQGNCESYFLSTIPSESRYGQAMLDRCRMRGRLVGTQLEHRWLVIDVSGSGHNKTAEIHTESALEFGKFVPFNTSVGDNNNINERIVNELRSQTQEPVASSYYMAEEKVWKIENSSLFTSAEARDLLPHLRYGTAFYEEKKKKMYVMYGSALYPHEAYSYNALMGSEIEPASVNRFLYPEEHEKQERAYDEEIARSASKVIANVTDKETEAARLRKANNTIDDDDKSFATDLERKLAEERLAELRERDRKENEGQSWFYGWVDYVKAHNPYTYLVEGPQRTADAAKDAVYHGMLNKYEDASEYIRQSRGVKAAGEAVIAGADTAYRFVKPLMKPTMRIGLDSHNLVQFKHSAVLGHHHHFGMRISFAESFGSANSRNTYLTLLRGALDDFEADEDDTAGEPVPSQRGVMLRSLGSRHPTYLLPNVVVNPNDRTDTALDELAALDTNGLYHNSEYYRNPSARTGLNMFVNLINNERVVVDMITSANAVKIKGAARELKERDAAANFVNGVPFLKNNQMEASVRGWVDAQLGREGNSSTPIDDGQKIGHLPRPFCSTSQNTAHHREGVTFSLLTQLLVQRQLEKLPSLLVELSPTHIAYNLEKAERYRRRLVDKYMLRSPRMVMKQAVSVVPVVVQAYLTAQLQSGVLIDKSNEWNVVNVAAFGATALASTFVPSLAAMVGTDAAEQYKTDHDDDFYVLPEDNKDDRRPADGILREDTGFRMPNMMPHGDPRTLPLRQELRYHLLMLTKDPGFYKEDDLNGLNDEGHERRRSIEFVPRGLDQDSVAYWKMVGFGRVVRHFAEASYVATAGHLQAQRLFGQITSHGEGFESKALEEMRAQSVTFDDTVLSDVMRDLRARGAPVPAHPTRLDTKDFAPEKAAKLSKIEELEKERQYDNIKGAYRVMRVRSEASAMMRRAFVANAMVEWPEFNDLLGTYKRTGESWKWQAADWVATVGFSGLWYYLTGSKNVLSLNCNDAIAEQLRRATAVAPVFNKLRDADTDLRAKQSLHRWTLPYRQTNTDFKITPLNMPSMWTATKYLVEGVNMPGYKQNQIDYSQSIPSQSTAKISTALINRFVHQDRSAMTYSQTFLKALWGANNPNQPKPAHLVGSRMPEMCLDPYFAKRLLTGSLFGSSRAAVHDISEPELRGVPSRAMVDIVEGLLSPKLAEFALISQRAIGAADALIGRKGAFSVGRLKDPDPRKASPPTKEGELRNAERAARLTVDELRWDRHVPEDRRVNQGIYDSVPWAHMRETALTLTGELVLCMCRYGHGSSADLESARAEWVKELTLLFQQSMKYDDTGVELMGYVEELDVRRDVYEEKQRLADQRGETLSSEPGSSQAGSSADPLLDTGARTRMKYCRNFVQSPDNFPGMKDVCDYGSDNDSRARAEQLVRLLSKSVIKCRTLRKAMHRKTNAEIANYLKTLVQDYQYGCFVFRTPYNVLLPSSCVPSALHRNSQRDGRVGGAMSQRTTTSKIAAHIARSFKSVLSTTFVSNIWQTVEDNSVVALVSAAGTASVVAGWTLVNVAQVYLMFVPVLSAAVLVTSGIGAAYRSVSWCNFFRPTDWHVDDGENSL